MFDNNNQVILERGGVVKCTTVVSYETQGLSVLLTKLKPGALTERDLPHGVIVSTVTQSPLFSFYHSLKNVYPQASINMKGLADSKKIQGLLMELEAGVTLM
jgi:hypothetical protein